MDSDGSQLIYIFVLAFLLIMKFFFSYCEFANIEVTRSKVKNLAQKDERYNKLLKLVENSPRLAVTFMTGRTVMTSLIAAVAAFASADLVPDSRYKWLVSAAGALCSAVVVTALTDIFPKKLVKHLNASALGTVVPVKLFMIVLFPFSVLSYGLSAAFCLISRVPVSPKKEEVTEEEILMMVDAGNQTGVIEQSQREMINNIFEFGDSVVSEVMTHRTDLCAADVETKIGDIVYLAINEGYSRIPIYEETVDSIIGILCVKDLLCLVGCEHSEDFTVRQFMRKAKYIPETCKCSDAFEEMTKEKCQFAVVVDEYGGTAGIVTLEDLLEEIVGNIQDEFDDEKADISEISEGVYTISGDMNPEDAAEILKISLPEEHNYDTMSAFIVDLLGRIPDENETPSVIYDDVEFTVLLAEDNWVSRIKAVCGQIKEETSVD